MWRWEARCPWNNEPVCNLTYMSGSLSHTAATVCLGLTQSPSSTVALLYFLIQSLPFFVLQSLLFILLFSSTFYHLIFYQFTVVMRKFIIKDRHHFFYNIFLLFDIVVCARNEKFVIKLEFGLQTIWYKPCTSK